MEEVREIVEFLEQEIKNLKKSRDKETNPNNWEMTNQRYHQTNYILGKIKWKYLHKI